MHLSYLTGKVESSPKSPKIHLAYMTKVLYLAGMDVREMARMGGEARAAALTPKKRREIALKASKAAAKARTQRARLKKQPPKP